MFVTYLSLLLLMLIRFVAMRSRWSRRPGRQGKGKHALSGAASRVIPACPALLARGSRGLFSHSGERLTAVDSGNACSHR
eukprot:9198455-Pyramimonas_sp.AAC.1